MLQKLEIQEFFLLLHIISIKFRKNQYLFTPRILR